MKSICELSFYLWIEKTFVDLSSTLVDLLFTHTEFWNKLSAGPNENPLVSLGYFRIASDRLLVTSFPHIKVRARSLSMSFLKCLSAISDVHSWFHVNVIQWLLVCVYLFYVYYLAHTFIYISVWVWKAPGCLWAMFRQFLSLNNNKK